MRKLIVAIALCTVVIALPAAQTPYYPPAGQWAHKAPAEAGMDAAKLNDAVDFMKAHETVSPPRDFSDQEIVFGKLLGSIPTERAATNGLIIRHGYIVAEFGDTLTFLPNQAYDTIRKLTKLFYAVRYGDRQLDHDEQRDLESTVRELGPILAHRPAIR